MAVNHKRIAEILGSEIIGPLAPGVDPLAQHMANKSRQATLPLTFVVPVRTRSELNERGHWSKAHRRARLAKRTVGGVLAIEGVLRSPPAPPVRVTLTRRGGRRLDPDNLAGALKHVQDALAGWLGVDDGDAAAVTWAYAQEPGGRWGVEVRVEAAPAAGVAP